MTNRLLAPLAKRVFLAFPIEGPRRRAQVGRERPPGAGRARAAPTAPRRAARFGIGAGRALRAGVRRLARRAPAQRRGARGLRRRRRRARSCTRAGGATTTTCASASTRSARRRTTTCTPYIEPFADALAAADLVVARAGGSVMELAAAGLPAMLVPYPHATADHQTANARFMEQAGRRGGGAGRRARRAAAGARGGHAAGRAAAPGGDGQGGARAWRGPTPPSGSPTSCWRWRAERRGRGLWSAGYGRSAIRRAAACISSGSAGPA